MTITRLELLIQSQVLPSSNNSLSMAVSVWHIDGTHLDSLKLTFSTLNTNIGPNVWFETPRGTQSSNALVYKDHGNSVVNIPYMGFMDTGTVKFDLFIQIYRTPITGNYPLTIQADMTLHESDYVFGGAGYVHTLGYPIVRHSFSGSFFVAFSIDPNGYVSKYNQYL